MSLKNNLRKKQNLLFPILIFLFAASIYLPTINIPFINDEIYFIKRNEVKSITQLYTLFNKKEYDGYYYRPLPDMISGLTFFFFKYNYKDYRVFNFLLHATAAVLIYFFIFSLLQIPGKKIIALFASLFFAGFPIHDYAVIWHTDLFDRVMILFYLAGLLAFVRNKFSATISSSIFFLLALLSKEMAFSFPLVIGLIYFFFAEPKFNVKKALLTALPYFVIAILFILARIILFNNDLFTAKDAHSTQSVFDAVKNYFLFTGLVIFPFFIRNVQSFITANKSLALITGIIIFAGIFFTIFKYKRRDYILFFFVLFFILTLAPASRLLLRWYLYLPSIGFTAALSYLIFKGYPKRINLKLCAAILILAVYSAALLQKETMWIKYSNDSVEMLHSFINKNRTELIKNKEAEFLTIPAKIDDVPIFQLGFNYLFNYYLGKNDSINVEYLSKSYLNNPDERINTWVKSGKIYMSQTDNNYFILFHNKKNIKFKPLNFKNGKVDSLSINISEVKDKILYTFSNGKFYKLEGWR